MQGEGSLQQEEVFEKIVEEKGKTFLNFEREVFEQIGYQLGIV